MLVLKKLHKGMGYFQEVDLYDTESGETFTTSKLAIKDKDVFGKMFYISGTFLPTEAYIEVDDFTWKLLDLIDSPIEVKRVVYHDFKRVSKICVVSGVDVFVRYPNSLEPIDKNLIFWKIGMLDFITILELYKYVFKAPIRFTPNMNVYLICEESGKYYKLDINEKVIRFMEKVMVLC